MCFAVFVFSIYGDHRYLPVLTHSFPTRRSSDLAWVVRLAPRSALSARSARPQRPAPEPGYAARILGCGSEYARCVWLQCHTPTYGSRQCPVVALSDTGARESGYLRSQARTARTLARSEEHTSELQSLMRIS